MSTPGSAGDVSPSRADIPRPRCAFEGCSSDAKWRQFNPPCRSYPLFLCTNHWLRVRMERPELIVAYGWIETFPRSEWGDAYRSPGVGDPGHAAYEVPYPEEAGVDDLVGQKQPVSA